MSIEKPWVALCKHNETADPEEIFISDNHSEVERAAAKWWDDHEGLAYDQSLYRQPRLSPWQCLNGDSVEVTRVPLGPGSKKWKRTISVVHLDRDGPVILFLQGTDVSFKAPSLKEAKEQWAASPVAVLHDEVQVVISADADLEAVGQKLNPLVQTCASDTVLKALARLHEKTPEEERAAYEEFQASVSGLIANPDDIPTFEQWAERARGRRNPNLD